MKNNPTKKRHGCFTVALQQMESALFIDTLFPALRNNGLFALPKHDSLIVDADKVGEARRIIEGILKAIGFQYHFKINGLKAKEPELIECIIR